MLVPPEGLVKLKDKAIPVVEQVKKMQTEVKLVVTRGQFFTSTLRWLLKSSRHQTL